MREDSGVPSGRDIIAYPADAANDMWPLRAHQSAQFKMIAQGDVHALLSTAPRRWCVASHATTTTTSSSRGALTARLRPLPQYSPEGTPRRRLEASGVLGSPRRRLPANSTTTTTSTTLTTCADRELRATATADSAADSSPGRISDAGGESGCSALTSGSNNTAALSATPVVAVVGDIHLFLFRDQRAYELAAAPGQGGSPSGTTCSETSSGCWGADLVLCVPLAHIGAVFRVHDDGGTATAKASFVVCLLDGEGFELFPGGDDAPPAPSAPEHVVSDPLIVALAAAAAASARLEHRGSDGVVVAEGVIGGDSDSDPPSSSAQYSEFASHRLEVLREHHTELLSCVTLAIAAAGGGGGNALNDAAAALGHFCRVDPVTHAVTIADSRLPTASSGAPASAGAAPIPAALLPAVCAALRRVETMERAARATLHAQALMAHGITPAVSSSNLTGSGSGSGSGSGVDEPIEDDNRADDALFHLMCPLAAYHAALRTTLPLESDAQPQALRALLDEEDAAFAQIVRDFRAARSQLESWLRQRDLQRRFAFEERLAAANVEANLIDCATREQLGRAEIALAQERLRGDVLWPRQCFLLLASGLDLREATLRFAVMVGEREERLQRFVAPLAALKARWGGGGGATTAFSSSLSPSPHPSHFLFHSPTAKGRSSLLRPPQAAASPLEAACSSSHHRARFARGASRDGHAVRQGADIDEGRRVLPGNDCVAELTRLITTPRGESENRQSCRAASRSASRGAAPPWGGGGSDAMERAARRAAIESQRRSAAAASPAATQKVRCV